jgi:hypothetical protein
VEKKPHKFVNISCPTRITVYSDFAYINPFHTVFTIWLGIEVMYTTIVVYIHLVKPLQLLQLSSWEGVEGVMILGTIVPRLITGVLCDSFESYRNSAFESETAGFCPLLVPMKGRQKTFLITLRGTFKFRDDELMLIA